MEKLFRDYLFTKGILVGEKENENSFHALFTLANLFAIKITKGDKLADLELVKYCSEMLGEDIPDPFYKGFPDSVLKLTKEQLLFDQLYNYYVTYDLGDFSEERHSLFEKDFEVTAFKENVEVKKFEILTKAEAEMVLKGYIENMLLSSRPLNENQFNVLTSYIINYNYVIEKCVCKDTVIRLALNSRKEGFEKIDLKGLTKFLSLSDVVKVVNLINFKEYDNKKIKNLNLTNKDRKFITALIYGIFEIGRVNVIECFEKKAIWNGLLHHIHIKAKSEEMQEFFNFMRGKDNLSVYSKFEKAMAEKDIVKAVNVLVEGKGQSVLLRNLNYIVSRCRTIEDLDAILKNVDSSNVMILIQLYIQYYFYKAGAKRTFKFTRFSSLLTTHEETDEEVKKRKSILSVGMVESLKDKIYELIVKNLKGKLNKVYISPNMYKIALPISETTSSSGYGVLPKGSRLPLGEFKKIRAFTYWEKVNDVDLSVIGLCDDGTQAEFSWRTMSSRGSDTGIVFSGDQVSGYNGGSEYYDIDIEQFQQNYPQVKKLIFCNNCYSDVPYSQFVCTAGFMIRDKEHSGEVFEPKTVKSSFSITAESTYASLFAFDIETREFVWLNTSMLQRSIVAGVNDLGYLAEYFEYSSILNVGKFFELMATEIVSDPLEADVIVSDEELEDVKEGVEIVKSCDFEKITALIG